MAGAAGGLAVVPAMAPARWIESLVARGQRSRPMDFCALRGDRRHRRDPRGHPPCGRCAGAEPSPVGAAAAGAMRCGRCPGAVGAVRADRRKKPHRSVDPAARAVPGHAQPRLLHHQARHGAARRPRPPPGAHRHRAPAFWKGRLMAWCGLGLLMLVAIGIVLSGLPAFVILIGVSVFGAGLGVLSGTIPVSLLTALPGRLINLLESDLLQALPLYVLMGLLLDRLPLADALYRSGLALLPKKPAAPLACGMGLG